MPKSDDFELMCQHCEYIFPRELTTGVVAAHMETEHGITEGIELILTMTCGRCNKPMHLVREEVIKSGTKLHYECLPCHRSKTAMKRL